MNEAQFLVAVAMVQLAIVIGADFRCRERALKQRHQSRIDGDLHRHVVGAQVEVELAQFAVRRVDAQQIVDLFRFTERRQDARALEMLLAREVTFDHGRGAPVAGKFIDQHGAMRLPKRGRCDLGGKNIGPAVQPRQGLVLGDHLG